MSDLPNLTNALNLAASYVQATWQQTVMGALQVPGVPEIKANIQLRRLYADSIVLGKRVDSGVNMQQFIIATHKAAKDLEYGLSKWDMKPGLLNGPKARMGKNGRYNIIPFRHGTSGAHGRDSNFKTMPKDILAAATKLKPSVATMQKIGVTGTGGMTTKMVPGKIKWGGRLTGTEVAHPPGKSPTTGYLHQAGRFEGMVKIQKTYEHATQSKYLTFRVVSEHSDPDSWWHPGYPAYHIAEKVANYCRPQVEAMIRDAATKDLASVQGVGMTVTAE